LTHNRQKKIHVDCVDFRNVRALEIRHLHVGIVSKSQYQEYLCDAVGNDGVYLVDHRIRPNLSCYWENGDDSMLMYGIWDHIRFVVCKRKKEERKKKKRKRVRKRRADAAYKELKKSSPGWLSETDSAATSNLACGRLGGIWATFLNSGGGRSTSEMDVPNPTAGSKVLELSQKHHTSNRCMFTEFQASTFGRYQ